MLAFLESLLGCQLAQVVLNLLLERLELLDVSRLGELGQLLEVDHADLPGLGRFLELLEQPVDHLQFFLDLERFRDGHGRLAGELILGGQLIDLILVREASHQLQQLLGKRALLAACRVPELLEVAQLLFVHGLGKAAAQFARRPHLPGHVVKLVVGVFLYIIGFIGRQDLALAFEQERLEPLEARAQVSDLAGVKPNGAGQLFLGQPPRVPVIEHVVEHMREHVGQRRRRAGKIDRVVFLIRVDDAAKAVI